MPPKPKLMVATTTFRAARGLVVSRGEIRKNTDPIVQANRDKFVDAYDWVEQATAAPGERRDARLR